MAPVTGSGSEIPSPTDSTAHTSQLSSSTDSIVSITTQISTKLNPNNYLMWKSQITPLLHGHNLNRFIEQPPPAPTTITTDGQLTLNPDYSIWHRQDQLLLGWLRSSLSESIMAQVVSCNTSMELWSSLQLTFASASRSRITDLKKQVQFAQRGNRSVTDFVQHIRFLGDELAFAGAIVSQEELVSAVINGLGPDYLNFVTTVTTSHRNESLSLSELHGMLLTHESILRQHTQASAMAEPSAFQAGRSSSTNNRNRPYNSPSPQYQPNNNNNMARPNTSSTPAQSNNKEKCQICLKPSHTAKMCYFRYEPDPNWKPRPPRQAFNAQVQQPNQSSTQPPAQQPSEWVIDSGATNHVTSDLNNLSAFFAYTGSDKLQLGNGSGLDIAHIGSTFLSISNFTVQLTDVSYVPHFSRNLLSLSKLLSDNPHITVTFSNYSCQFAQLHTKTVLPISSHHGLFILHATSFSPQAFLGTCTSASIWHSRLGHPSKSTTMSVLHSYNLPCNSNKLDVCHDCAIAKSHQLPFSSSSHSSTSPLEIVHSDVWGPCPIVSKNGYKYYLIFVDEFTRFTWIFFLRQKSDVIQVFSNFKAQVENLLNTSIKILRTDNGTEFKPIANKFPQITHQTTCPYTPQQNGLAERKHRHIVELSLAIMSKASIPTDLWDEVFSSAVFLINRLPSTATSEVPFIALFKKPPDYQFLRVLGCLCFPHTRPYSAHKLEYRATPCVFIGYATSQKGYRCLHIESNRVFVSRNVQFDENVFPFKDILPTTTDPHVSNNNSPSSPLLLVQNMPSTDTDKDNSVGADHIAHDLNIGQPSSDRQHNQPPPGSNGSPDPAHCSNSNSSLPQIDSYTNHTVTPSHNTTSPSTNITPQPLLLTNSPSQQAPPTTRSHTMTTRAKDNTLKHRQFPDYVAYSTTVTSEPTCFTAANKIEEWRAAMSSEINALARNKTWVLVPPPLNQKIIGCKWVYKLKQKPDGTVERYKARLVAKGFHQEEGVDFFDTYSPVVRPTTIRVVLSLAISSHWSVRQLDVHNAFLHGDLQEQVYMAQPPGFTDPTHPDYVCLLSKSLYGLKQAPRAWFQKLSSALLTMGFKASSYDPSLFIGQHNNNRLFILVYVDDILVTGNSLQMVTQCIQQLQQQFAVKDLGDLSFFLGMEATTTDTGMLLTQTKYITDLLHKTKMLSSKPCTTPIATHITLSKKDGDPFSEPHLYRSVVGALQYATLTRPDISFAVNKVSQFMHEPTVTQWTAVKRILRYLAGTLHHGLFIHANSSTALHGYSDADWAGCTDDRRSTSGFCVYLGKTLVSWSAKKQPTVSRSSTEAEYRSLALTCAEIMWLQFLLQELNITLPQPPTLWCDNIGATFLAANPMFHARTKHIEIDYHFVRERVASNKLCVRFVCSKDQLADVMTKPLATTRFQFLRNKLNVFQKTLVCGGVLHDNILMQLPQQIKTED
ncbi:hypothetical protein LUZ61_008875 [Rhynchospora tenuis]|uniref:Integrase catalytic domain-containing protein n=1 Tax=Rhynchospora tenuis TaxID=198213 RepID=A0AAD5ZW63_9POAL|nr:hypothetical protein LUZ61_008875 [Rhynchospora tenuis]